MNRKYISQISAVLALFMVLLTWSCGTPPAPSVVSHKPEFGPEGTLITVEGMDFEDLLSIQFNDGVDADFNPSFGTATALLLRVPEDAPLGDNTVQIKTEGGEISFPFRVTLLPPQVANFNPKNANAGAIVSITGENFFEPLEVLFFDSIAGEIIYSAEDSLAVIVPEGVEKGQIKVKANGGSSLTAEVFFSTTEVLVNDFDGNGLRAETGKWLFYGNIDQNAANAVVNNDPEPIEGNFLKISGKDPGSTWIGGAESHSWDVADFEAFPIQSDINNTFIEMDVHNNGITETHLIIALAERAGSPNDFSITVQLEKSGWNKISIPLNRFKDIEGFTIDPRIIRTVKLQLYNELQSSKRLQANIDNLKFIQIN